MDSKAGYPPSSRDSELAPPSYYDSLLSSSNNEPAGPGPSTPHTHYYSRQIQSQLHTLTSQMSSLKVQKSLLSDAQDQNILSLLTFQIQLYLSAFAKTGLEKGTLILVPARGLEEDEAGNGNGNAEPAEFQDEKRGGAVEYDRFVRITTTDNKEGGDGDDGNGNEQGDMWFWRDEDMATRLAAYLKPVPDLKNAPLPPRKEEVMKTAAEPGSSSRGFWGRKKSASTVSNPALVAEEKRRQRPRDEKLDQQPVDVLHPSASDHQVEGEETVLMDVKAEEVVFRTENDFGILETLRGWGIVLRLRVVQRKG